MHPESINLVCSFGSDCSDCGARDTFWLPHWAAITISLMLTALVDAPDVLAGQDYVWLGRA